MNTLIQPKRFEKRLLIVALAIGCLLPSIFISLGLLTHTKIDWRQILTSAIFSFFITISITYINIKIANILARKYPWDQGWTKRLVIELSITSLSAAVIISFVGTVLYITVGLHSHFTFALMIVQNALIAIVINIILITILEGRELFQMYKDSILETETLKRQNIESQYSALINQVNPHFLFNSLNVLSFLVTSNPPKAQEFISRFSWIYRYVLDVKDKSLVSLDQELEFLNAYLFLQKLRYDEKLDFRIDIAAQVAEVYIPPLSLQIIIENAIKHNEISKLHPLMIEIKVDREFLEVKNKFKSRKDKEPSTGFGLENLYARYANFTDIKPHFGLVGDEFIAKIPLLSE